MYQPIGSDLPIPKKVTGQKKQDTYYKRSEIDPKRTAAFHLFKRQKQPERDPCCQAYPSEFSAKTHLSSIVSSTTPQFREPDKREIMARYDSWDEGTLVFYRRDPAVCSDDKITPVALNIPRLNATAERAAGS